MQRSPEAEPAKERKEHGAGGLADRAGAPGRGTRGISVLAQVRDARGAEDVAARHGATEAT
jgi:hypothetical protein